MRVLFPLIALLSTFTVFGQISPTLQEIYSFSKGDVFIYRNLFISNDNPQRRTITTEYDTAIIREKQWRGDTLKVIMQFKTWKTPSTYWDTLIIVDSTDHPLNRAPYSLNNYPSIIGPTNCPSNGHEADTAVKIVVPVILDDTDTFKMLVNTDYPLEKDNVNGYLELDDLNFYPISDNCAVRYKKGLGQVSAKQSFFESYCIRELLVHISEMDTTFFTLSNNDNFKLSRVLVFPNPAQSKLSIAEAPTHANYRVVDIRGRTKMKGKLVESTVDVSELTSGLYIFLVQTESIEYRSRFVKL